METKETLVETAAPKKSVTQEIAVKESRLTSETSNWYKLSTKFSDIFPEKSANKIIPGSLEPAEPDSPWPHPPVLAKWEELRERGRETRKECALSGRNGGRK